MIMELPRLTRPSLQTWTRQLHSPDCAIWYCVQPGVYGCERHSQDARPATFSSILDYYLATFFATGVDSPDSQDRTGASFSANAVYGPFGIAPWSRRFDLGFVGENETPHYSVRRVGYSFSIPGKIDTGSVALNEVMLEWVRRVSLFEYYKGWVSLVSDWWVSLGEC